MFAHLDLHASALQGYRRLRAFASASAAGLCLLLLAACTTAPTAPVAGAHPASQEARTRTVRYQSVIGPYTSQRPRDPGGWRDNNATVAPQEKP